MNLINKIDILFMKIFVKPVLSQLERWTGVTPFILCYLTALCGIVSIPIATILALFETSKLFGGSNLLCKYVVVVLGLFNFCYLRNIMGKARWRYERFLERDLHTVTDTGVIYDSSRPKWFPSFLMVIAGICIMPRLNGITFSLIPIFFFWPALVVSGVRPYYITDKKEQEMRLSRLLMSSIVLLLFFVCMFHFMQTRRDVRSTILLIITYGTLVNVILRVIIKNDKK